MRAFWLLVAAVVGGVLVWQGRPWFEQRTAPAVEAVPRVIEPRGDLASDEKSTIELFERSKGSVVFITTTQLVRDLWSRSMFSIPRGAGSGFVWDNDGHVITNNHVVRGAAEAKVRLNDGRDYSARLVGESAGLKVGQKVFAIGNPFGLDWSLTTGVVSALDRSLPAEDGRTIIEHLIQTGINTAIFSPSGAFAGVGFAVPVDTVNRVVPQLMASRCSRSRPARPPRPRACAARAPPRTAASFRGTSSQRSTASRPT